MKGCVDAYLMLHLWFFGGNRSKIPGLVYMLLKYVISFLMFEMINWIQMVYSIYINSFQTEVILKFWSNGFSVDDGPLRAFDDPANQQFLNSVKRG